MLPWHFISLHFQKKYVGVKTYYAETSDGILISFDVYVPKNVKPRGSVVFIHSYSGNKRYWETFAVAVACRGFICLALDLRGHGASTGYMVVGPKIRLEENYKLFEKDVEAVLSKGRELGLISAKLAVVGHSMGGGLALYLGYFWESVDVVVAIAPGLFGNYVTPEHPKHILFIAGARDSIIPAEYVTKLYKMAGGEVGAEETVTKYNTTRMLYIDPDATHSSIVIDKDVVSLVASWLEEKLTGSTSSNLVYVAYSQGASFHHCLIFCFASSFIPARIYPKSRGKDW